jgi:hypothetical protein
MAALLGMQRQRFTNGMCFAKWVEQILCVKTVVRSKTGDRRNHAVRRKFHRTFACCVIINVVNPVLKIVLQFKSVWHECNETGGSCLLMMAQCRCNFHIILNENDRDRPFG